MSKFAIFDILPRHVRPVPEIAVAVADTDCLQRAADEWCRRQENARNLNHGTLRAIPHEEQP